VSSSVPSWLPTQLQNFMLGSPVRCLHGQRFVLNGGWQIAYRLSLIAYRLSLIAYRLSLIAYRLLLIAYRLSLIAYCLSRFSRITYHASRITYHAICHTLYTTRHPLLRLVPQNFLNSFHNIRRKFFYKLKRFHIVVDLRHTTRAGNDCADIWILQTPRQS